MSIKPRLLVVLGGALTMCNGLQLFTAVESLVATPYAKLEKKVASQQIPAVAAAPAPRKTLAGAGAGGASFDHSAWDALLKAHVRDDGTVDYGGLERDGDAFRGYLAALAAADVDALGDREQLALHLNAYNALCVAHVLPVHGTLKSILDLSEKDAPIWDKVAGEVGGVAVSLNDIEHGRLRLRWDEPELHACIVCASTSCPSLARFAFAGDGLERDMRARAESWLRDGSKGCAAERGGAVARLSRICLWFEDDFDTRGGAAAFVRDHVDGGSAAARALDGGAALRYFPYDWSLNKVAK